MANQNTNGLINMQTPLLQSAEAKIEASIPAAQRANYLKIVVAGMKVALNRGPSGLLGALKASKDPLSDCVNGAIGIVGILRRESRGTMPVATMVPAAFSLVLHGLDFLQKMQIMQIGNNELDQATHAFSEAIMHKLGITPQKVQQLSAQAHSVMVDPQAVTRLQQVQSGGTNGAA